MPFRTIFRGTKAGATSFSLLLSNCGDINTASPELSTAIIRVDISASGAVTAETTFLSDKKVSVHYKFASNIISVGVNFSTTNYVIGNVSALGKIINMSNISIGEVETLASMPTGWTAMSVSVLYSTLNKPTAADVGALPVGGTAVAAQKLATARSINGTNFDGSGNITTAKWGAARNLTIGNATKSVDGSGNVTFTLSDIGAGLSDEINGTLTVKSDDSSLILEPFYPNHILSNKPLEIYAGTGSADGMQMDLLCSALEVKWGYTYKPVSASKFNTSSARRYKENFSDVTEEECRHLLEIPVKHFDYIDGDKNQTGFIAEDVEPFYPEICSYGKDIVSTYSEDAEDKLQGLDYSRFSPYIVKLLQVQQKEIDAQKQKIESLEQQILTIQRLLNSKEGL